MLISCFCFRQKVSHNSLEVFISRTALNGDCKVSEIWSSYEQFLLDAPWSKDAGIIFLTKHLEVSHIEKQLHNIASFLSVLILNFFPFPQTHEQVI